MDATCLDVFELGSSFLGVRALVHILTNSVQYSSEGSLIQILLSVQDDQAVIQITDQGIGIPPAEQGRIWEPLFRGTNIGECSGLGLGLTFAQATVLAHHGAIAVRSELNHGTTVTLKLPMRAEET